MSSNLSSLIRLGICRGWRMKLAPTKLVYSVSVLHCLFIYLILRAKAAKLGLWVVSYFILCTLKKYVIHVCFWRIPGRKKSRIVGGWAFNVSSVVLRRRRRIRALEFQKFRFSIKPTKLVWESARRLNRKAVISSNTLGGLFPWVRSRALLTFWWNKHYKLSFNALLSTFSYKNMPFGQRTRFASTSVRLGNLC